MRVINNLIAQMPIFPFGNLLRSLNVRLIAYAMSVWIGFSIQNPVYLAYENPFESIGFNTQIQ
ncbi:hypothetical protein D3C73_665540 [compost metagenome]